MSQHYGNNRYSSAIVPDFVIQKSSLSNTFFAEIVQCIIHNEKSLMFSKARPKVNATPP